MLSGGICTHEEIRGVLKDALADVGLRAVVAGLMKGAVKGLIVDEVFDGNRLDLELVKVAVEAGISTTLIGDPWQALYEFRGAEPRLVPVIIDDLEFETFAISDSFRFTTALMRTLAERLRGGSPVQLNAGSAGETDVVLASHWRSLWAVSTSVLPYAFGQINNRTDAALALLLEPLATAHFGQLARAAPEAASALSLTPDVVRSELPAIAARVFARISDGSSEDAVAALALLRRELRDIGGRNIPVLAEPQEAARVANLVALSARLGRPRLIPGMTVHQAKGREWNAVGVRLQPDQLGRLAAGLAVDRAGDREIYVALTRAKESLVTL
jgi:DNA helicase-2/ATP-dependent DNA helicase PcrA